MYYFSYTEKKNDVVVDLRTVFKSSSADDDVRKIGGRGEGGSGSCNTAYTRYRKNYNLFLNSVSQHVMHKP